MSHDERDVETVAEALIEAAARVHFDHSHRGSRGIDGEDLTWADEVDAPYGKGAYRAMMRPVVAAVLDALDVPGRERRAKAEALREAATEESHRLIDSAMYADVRIVPAARLLARAAWLDPEEGDHE